MKTTECAIRYAMSKYCTVTKQGRTNHVELSIPQACAQQMLIYMLTKGYTEDNLANTFKQEQRGPLVLCAADPGYGLCAGVRVRSAVLYSADCGADCFIHCLADLFSPFESD